FEDGMVSELQVLLCQYLTVSMPSSKAGRCFEDGQSFEKMPRKFSNNHRRRCACQLPEGVGVQDAEGAAALVEDLKDAQATAIGAGHGHGQQVARGEAGAPVYFLVEARVGVGIVDVDCFARLGDAAGDARADGDADLAFFLAQGDLGPKLAAG